MLHLWEHPLCGWTDRQHQSHVLEIKANCISQRETDQQISTKSSIWKKYVTCMTFIRLSLLSQVTLSIVGWVYTRFMASQLRGHTAGTMCVVSVRGEDLWVSSFKGGQHGESNRVQEVQCSEPYSSAHSREQQRDENQMKAFWETEVWMVQKPKLILFTIYGRSYFSTEF